MQWWWTYPTPGIGPNGPKSGMRSPLKSPPDASGRCGSDIRSSRTKGSRGCQRESDEAAALQRGRQRRARRPPSLRWSSRSKLGNNAIVNEQYEVLQVAEGGVVHTDVAGDVVVDAVTGLVGGVPATAAFRSDLHKLNAVDLCATFACGVHVQ